MTKREKFTLIAAILGSGIVFLDGTVVNIALPAIAHGLHTDYSGLQWVVDAYLLTLSAMILFGGSLGDLFGQKRIFTIGLIGFGAASLLCGIASNITILTIARLLQGALGALLVPSSLAVINTTFDRERRPHAIGIWTAYGGIFTAIGPLIGGVLIALSWRWIFLLNIPLILACFYAINQGVTDPSHEQNSGRRLDTAGGLLAVIALGGITYGLIEGPAHGWTSLSVGSIAVALAALIAFLVYEHRHHDPMVPFGLFRSRNFTGANLATLAMYAALNGALVSVILYLQTALHYSPLAAGLSFLPVTLLMFLISSKMGALTAKYGARLFMTIGPLMAAVGFLMMLRITPEHHNYFSDLLPAVITFGLGLSITVAPLTATVMGSVQEHNSGIASGINNAAARIAGLLMIAALGVVVASQTTHFISLQKQKLSNQSVETISQSIASGLDNASLQKLPVAQRPAVTTTVAQTQRGLFAYAIAINAGLAAAAGVISWILIRKPKPEV
jgi:EmrB/QacA subfamily drug resistance transporter